MLGDDVENGYLSISQIDTILEENRLVIYCMLEENLT